MPQSRGRVLAGLAVRRPCTGNSREMPPSRSAHARKRGEATQVAPKPLNAPTGRLRGHVARRLRSRPGVRSWPRLMRAPPHRRGDGMHRRIGAVTRRPATPVRAPPMRLPAGGYSATLGAGASHGAPAAGADFGGLAAAIPRRPRCCRRSRYRCPTIAGPWRPRYHPISRSRRTGQRSARPARSCSMSAETPPSPCDQLCRSLSRAGETSVSTTSDRPRRNSFTYQSTGLKNAIS